MLGTTTSPAGGREKANDMFDLHFLLISILITKSITMFYFNNCLLFCTESLTMNILLRGFLFLNCIEIGMPVLHCYS